VLEQPQHALPGITVQKEAMKKLNARQALISQIQLNHLVLTAQLEIIVKKERLAKLLVLLVITAHQRQVTNTHIPAVQALTTHQQEKLNQVTAFYAMRVNTARQKASPQ
jgi:hypothetical protein